MKSGPSPTVAALPACEPPPSRRHAAPEFAADDALLAAAAASFGLVLAQPGGGVRAYTLNLTRADSEDWPGHLRGTLTGRAWGPGCAGAAKEALPPLNGSCELHFKVREEL